MTLLALLGFDQINSNNIKYWFLRSGENWSSCRKTSPSREEKVTNSTNIGWRDWDSHPGHTVGRRVKLPLLTNKSLYYLHILYPLTCIILPFHKHNSTRVFQTGGAFVGISAYYDTIHCLPRVSYRIEICLISVQFCPYFFMNRRTRVS